MKSTATSQMHKLHPMTRLIQWHASPNDMLISWICLAILSRQPTQHCSLHCTQRTQPIPAHATHSTRHNIQTHPVTNITSLHCTQPIPVQDQRMPLTQPATHSTRDKQTHPVTNITSHTSCHSPRLCMSCTAHICWDRWARLHRSRSVRDWQFCTPNAADADRSIKDEERAQQAG